MRTLSRPMFNMGGPIKQGIMNGIREPKKNGGLSKQFNTGLVGDERYPKTKGREHHVGFLAPLYWAGQAALRMGPSIYRGIKAGKYIKGWRPTAKFRQPSVPTNQVISGKYNPAPLTKKEMFTSPEIWGKAIRENPWTAFTLASAAPQAGALGYKGAKAGLKALPGALKRYADLVIPGDQSRWWKEKTPIETVPGVPGSGDQEMYYDKTKKEPKKLSEAERKAFALAQREKRVEKYLDLMGYDRSKKMAIADALIDASKIVGDRGTLKPENIGRDLINPIIQATSKRLDKPQQIREAVGLMATKAEIEKDLNEETDALAKKLTLTKIKQGERSLEEGFEIDIRNLLLTSRTAPSKKTLERYARLSANKYGLDFTKVADDTVRNAAGETEEEKIQSVVGDDGIYMIGDAIIKVTGGVPIQVA